MRTLARVVTLVGIVAYGGYLTSSSSDAFAASTELATNVTPNRAGGAVNASECEIAVPRSRSLEPCPRGTDVPPPDEDVALRVREELTATDAISMDTIAIDVSSGVVTLTGSVRSKAEKLLADLLAGSVEGVVAVVNVLTVT